ncbi:hypothetical protein ACJX0J_010966, partial [Zea mays]
MEGSKAGFACMTCLMPTQSFVEVQKNWGVHHTDIMYTTLEGYRNQILHLFIKSLYFYHGIRRWQSTTFHLEMLRYNIPTTTLHAAVA